MDPVSLGLLERSTRVKEVMELHSWGKVPFTPEREEALKADKRRKPDQETGMGPLKPLLLTDNVLSPVI